MDWMLLIHRHVRNLNDTCWLGIEKVDLAGGYQLDTISRSGVDTLSKVHLKGDEEYMLDGQYKQTKDKLRETNVQYTSYI